MSLFHKKSQLSGTVNTAPRWRLILLNKYVIASVLFVVYFCFLDSTNLLVTLRLSRKVSQLHQEEQRLQEEITADSLRVSRLVGNIEELERFGREEYFMKRDNEDVYIIGQEEK